MQVYLKSNKVRIRKHAKKIYFTHKNNQPIRTDNLGVLIWQSCNGSSFDQIKKSIRKKINCPNDLLKSYLSLLNTAGIIKKEHSDKRVSNNYSSKSTFFNDTVSIIIINYNGEEFITNCLNSIRRQTHKNKEIVLWDNNSSDNSLKIIKEKFPEVKVIPNKKNILFAKAVNLSMERCRGDYIIILNPDTTLDKNFIQELLKKVKREREIAAVVPKMMFLSLPTCINGIGNYVPPYGWGSDSFAGHFDFGQYDTLEEVPSACFGAVMLSRRALEDIGPIDIRYKAYYEDADWSYRARLMGWKIVPAPQAKAYHKFESSFKDFPVLKSKLVVRNRIRFAIKIFSFYYLKGFMKNYLKEDLGNFFHSLINFNFKNLKIYFLSYLSLFIQLPELLISRVKTQRLRNKKISDMNILKLAPHYPPLLDETSSPILTVESIRNIYRWELHKIRKKNRELSK